MTPKQALAFVRKHGVVLASAKGPVPNVVEAVAKEPITGSWWGHRKGREIFRVLQHLQSSKEILVCRLVERKVTFIHRRLWPALMRTASHFPASSIAQVREEHTSAGHHVTRDVAFPKWVPAEVAEEARRLSENEALDALGAWTTQKPQAHKRSVRKKVARKT